MFDKQLYRLQNKEKLKAYQAEYRLNKPEIKRLWVSKNRDRINAYQRKWYDQYCCKRDNPDLFI